MFFIVKYIWLIFRIYRALKILIGFRFKVKGLLRSTPFFISTQDVLFILKFLIYISEACFIYPLSFSEVHNFIRSIREICLRNGIDWVWIDAEEDVFEDIGLSNIIVVEARHVIDELLSLLLGVFIAIGGATISEVVSNIVKTW